MNQESRLAIVIDSQDSKKEVTDLTKRLDALEKAGLRATDAANDHGNASDKAAKKTDKYGKNTKTATARMNVMNGVAKKLAVTMASIGFAALVKNTLNSADELGKLSTRLGESVEDLSRLQYAARLTGVSTQTLNLGLQRMTRRVSEAAQGTGEAVGALQELNLSADAMNKLSPADQFKALADALEDVESPSDKVRLSMKLLDSEGVALIQTMEGGADAIERMGIESDKTGNTMSAEFAQKAADANDAMTKLTATGQGLLNEVVLALAPALTTVANLLSENATEVVVVTGAVATFTVGLKAARLAQIAFNTAAKANPYVLIASALATVGAGIFAYSEYSKQASNSTAQLNEDMTEYRNTLAKLDKSGLEAWVKADTKTVENLTEKLDGLKKKQKELEGLRTGRTMNDDGLILPTITPEQRKTLSQLPSDIQAVEKTLKTYTDRLKESEDELEAVNKKLETQQRILSEQEIESAINTLNQLRAGYDKVGLATEAYKEQEKQLQLLLQNGNITRPQYNAALAEAQKRMDDAKYGVSEAKKAYESLREEYDKSGVAADKLSQTRKQLNTLHERGVINLDQYKAALAAAGEAFDEVHRAETPHLKAQDDLAAKYVKNKELLESLRVAQAASNSGDKNLQTVAGADVTTQLTQGMAAPTYDGSNLEGTATGMEQYQAQYELRLAQLREFENEKYGIQAEATAAREELEKSHKDRMQAYNEQMINQSLSASANMFGSLLSLSSQYAGESSDVTQALMGFQKAAQIGQSIMAINTGIANASALPFPANIPAIASVVSATAGIVSTIASINPPSKPSFNTNTNFAGAYDKGGNIPAGKWGIAGEIGPEIVEGPARVTSRKDTAKMLNGGGQNVNVTVNYTNNAKGGGSDDDGKKQGKQIADMVKAQVLTVIRGEQRPGGSLAK